MTRNGNMLLSASMVLSVVFCGLEAALETHYLHKLCGGNKLVVLDWTTHPTRSAILKYNRFSEEPVDCEVAWRLGYKDSPVLSIISYNLLHGDKFVITDNDNFKIQLTGRGHFLDERKSFSSEGRLTVRFTLTNSSGDISYDDTTKFEFVYTIARKGPCFDNEFECKNLKCINRKLVCDGHNQCGDRSDEKNCFPKTGKDFDYSEVTIVKGRTNAFIITVIVLGVVLGIVLFAMMGVFIHRIKKKKPSQLSSPNATAPVQSGPIPPDYIGQQHPINPSFFSQIRNSFRSKKNPIVEVPKENMQNHQIPSIYPQTSLPMAEITTDQMAATQAIHQQQQPSRSFMSKVKRSFRSAKNTDVEQDKHPKKSDNHQTPSIYPEIPSAPEIHGVDNPDFEIE